ncbi:hypothetical protein HDU76_010065 [Blyttiomyces sp. JEL0837]|nr:hypothetical protein HDU76_010065 [Blyttiomyces sp. JEL0837]
MIMEWAKQVQSIVGDEHSLETIIEDLRVTKSVEVTVNRVFDGLVVATKSAVASSSSSAKPVAPASAPLFGRSTSMGGFSTRSDFADDELDIEVEGYDVSTPKASKKHDNKWENFKSNFDTWLDEGPRLPIASSSSSSSSLPSTSASFSAASAAESYGSSSSTHTKVPKPALLKQTSSISSVIEIDLTDADDEPSPSTILSTATAAMTVSKPAVLKSTFNFNEMSTTITGKTTSRTSQPVQRKPGVSLDNVISLDSDDDDDVLMSSVKPSSVNIPKTTSNTKPTTNFSQSSSSTSSQPKTNRVESSSQETVDLSWRDSSVISSITGVNSSKFVGSRIDFDMQSELFSSDDETTDKNRFERIGTSKSKPAFATMSVKRDSYVVTGGLSEAVRSIIAASGGLGASGSSNVADAASATVRNSKMSSRQARDILDTLSDTGSIDGGASETNKAAGKKRKRNPDDVAAEKAAKEAEKMRKEAEKAVKKEEKERQKELAKAAKAEEKERLKRQKEEEKAKTQDGKRANKIRDKHECCKEMIFEVDPAFVAQPGGAAIISSIQQAGAIIKVANQKLATAARWKRKVTREWDPVDEIWKPAPERVELEPFVLLRVSATEFGEAALGLGGGIGVGSGSSNNGVEALYAKVRRLYPEERLIFFIEGISEFLKKRTMTVSAQIRAGVRANPTGNGGGGSSSRVQIACKEDFEEGMLVLQFKKGCFVQMSETMEESAMYIKSFTTSIGTIPERAHRNELAFKLRFGDSVKSGSDLPDIWRRMLMEIKPCTENAATAIMKLFPNFISLTGALQNAKTESAQMALLENIVMERTGGSGARRLGPALARKIVLAFTSTDPTLSIFDPPPPPRNRSPQFKRPPM